MKENKKEKKVGFRMYDHDLEIIDSFSTKLGLKRSDFLNIAIKYFLKNLKERKVDLLELLELDK